MKKIALCLLMTALLLALPACSYGTKKNDNGTTTPDTNTEQNDTSTSAVDYNFYA